MSHLGFRLLHASLLSRDDLCTERVFLPWPDLQALLQRESLPLFTLESQTPLQEFDLLGLSLQYELAQPAVLKLLDLARIPRRAADRAAGAQRFPLVLVGGSGALNPEPLAPFADCFFVGEADEAIHEIVDALAEVRAAPRAAQLARLGQIAGVYVPGWYEASYPEQGLDACLTPGPGAAPLPIERRLVEDLDGLPLPAAHLVPFCSIVHDRVAIEIQRGCSHGCRFCQSGFVTRPTRQRSADRVLELARALLRQTGYEDLSLLSLSAGDHPCLQPLLAALLAEHGPERVAISLPSLRSENLDPIVAEHLGKVRKASFTLAPEAGTDRLRQVINKHNTEADLLQSVRAVARAGYTQIKLYFMIGLPTETDEDVLAIADLVARVISETRGARRAINLTAGVSTFVPKPHTPFQWEAAPDMETIRHRQRLLQERFPRRARLKWHDAGQSMIEAYLARADRRMAAVLARVVTPESNGLEAWTEHFQLERWQRALAAAHQAGEIPEPALWLGPRDLAAPLPWDHIDVGVERRYLERERQAAIAGDRRADCSLGDCDHCGVCPEDPRHRLAHQPPTVPSFAGSRVGGSPATEAPRDNAPPLELRLWFHKVGRASLLAHLEMSSAFERALRRAGLPLRFTAGYHPKPRLRFSPALPLGAESHCEFAELGLTRPVEPERAWRALAAELPPGLLPQRCERAVTPYQRGIRGVIWRFVLERPMGAALEALQQRLRAGPVALARRGKKEVDLRAFILDLRAGDETSFEASCPFGSDGTLRPAEILDALPGLDEPTRRGAHILRLGWLTRDPSVGDP